MTEVPEHLLQRSRDRRNALGLGGGDAGGDAAPASPAASASTEVATAATAAPAKASAKVAVEAAPKAPAFIPPYVEASERRQRIPMWAFPVLAFLPVWAVIYAQSLSAPPSTVVTQIAAGGAIFASNCSGCHGAAGGGGTGRKMSDGEIIKTFPDIAGQLQFAWLGTNEGGYSGKPYGNPDRPGGPHIGLGIGAPMPKQKGTLTEKELLEVVRHEREVIGGESPDTFKVNAAGDRLWMNGAPMLDATGKLVWDDGTPMFDADGKLTKQIDQTKPAP